LRQTIRIVLAVILGLATLLFGQLALEIVAWWWTSGTSSFDSPLLNAIKFAVAGTAGLAVGTMIAKRPIRRRRMA
jgi:hypothetical protein